MLPCFLPWAGIKSLESVEKIRHGFYENQEWKRDGALYHKAGSGQGVQGLNLDALFQAILTLLLRSAG